MCGGCGLRVRKLRGVKEKLISIYRKLYPIIGENGKLRKNYYYTIIK